MLLCLDVGNSQIAAGLFDQEKLLLKFRYNSRAGSSSDELGVFLRSTLRENGFSADDVTQIAVGSVVPSLDYSLTSACIKYFNCEPFFLKAGVKTGLKIKTANPVELGADLIAGAISAVQQFPNKPIIIVDFGTATTFAVISKECEYLGTVILPGLNLSMRALGDNTAKLLPVEIIKPEKVVGRTTVTSIQSGIYYSQVAVVKELVKRISYETFQDEQPIVIGTGGFVSLFESEQIFSKVCPDLVLHGLKRALHLNNGQ